MAKPPIERINAPTSNGRQQAPPPLAYWRKLSEWEPKYGDYIVWAGWFSQWHGVVSTVDNDILSVIFSGLPLVLFTLTDQEQAHETYQLAVSQIRTARAGSFAVMQHDYTQNASIWYI